MIPITYAKDLEYNLVLVHCCSPDAPEPSITYLIREILDFHVECDNCHFETKYRERVEEDPYHSLEIVGPFTLGELEAWLRQKEGV